MKKSIFLFVWCLFSIVNLYSQEIRLENWKCWSSLLTPTSITNDNLGNLWISTTGGVLKCDGVTEDLQQYRNIDALMSINLTKVKVNPLDNAVYFAHKSGWLDIYQADGTWKHISDIFVADNFPNKQINDIEFNNEIAYIAGGFGLAVFDMTNKVFIENIIRIGSLPINTEINEVTLIENKIWLATSNGISYADLDASLSDPSSWTVLPKNIGFEEDNVKKIISHLGAIYFASGQSIYTLENDTAKKEINDWDGVIGVCEFEGKLAYATSYRVYANGVYLDKFKNTLSPINGIEVVKYKNKEYLAVFVKEDGLYLYSDIKDTNVTPAYKFQPNTPLTNSFMDIKVNIDGSVWMAADEYSTGIGKGFMRFDGSNWEIFTSNKYPELVTNNFYKIACSSDGRVFASNFGQGLFEVKKNEQSWEFKQYSSHNSAFKTVYPELPEPYIIAGETVVDNSGIVWSVNRGEDSPGPILVSIDKFGNSNGFINKNNSNSRGVMTLAIDGFGTKWIGGNVGNGKGLIYYNENNTVEDKSDDISGIITATEYDELLSNEHTALEFDYNRVLWIGTPAGLVAIANLNFMFYNSKPIIRSVPILQSQPINDIAIDPQNRKWVATTKGLWVIDENGNKVLAQITSENSPLSTNDIKSIEINDLSGEVYIGTKNGLFIANTLSIKPLEEYDIKCFPQPFNINKDTELFIDGLSSQSEIRILTLSGALVKVFHTDSRKLVWDGTDENGNKVIPGIYLIVSKSGDSNSSGVGKIAIIRD